MKTGQVIYLMKGEPGDDGKPGSRGPSLRGPMDWKKVDAGFEFQSGKEGEQFVDYVVSGGAYYLCTTSHEKTAGNGPGSNYDYWQAASEYPFVATDLLMAAYAVIENLGVRFVELSEGGYIRMTDGSDNVLFEVKDGNVTCKTGTFENVTVSGTISGILQSLRTAGNEIVLNATQAWLNGVDIYNQGTKDGRSLRLYGSDIWCRGYFAARQRTIARVVGRTVYYYPKGVTGAAQTKTLTAKTTSDGQTYYSVPCYGDTGDMSGMPVDTIVFSNASTDYRYEPGMVETQRLLVINGQDQGASHTKLYLNGTLYTIEGGESMTLVKLPPAWMVNTPAEGAVGRGIALVSRYDDNW